MRRCVWTLMLPFFAQAADDALARGTLIFRQSCAVAYCHGPEGKPGRAPALGGRRFDADTVSGIVATGIPNTSMPAFSELLKPQDIAAVVAYIISLNKSEGATAAVQPTTMPPEIEQGRGLFFDAARMGGCGSCHEVGERGARVSLALQDLQTAKLDDLRAVETPKVVTARATGEPPFPAVVVEKGATRTRVYDLSSRLPVLRTFRSSDVVLAQGSSWSHRTVAAIYTDAELAAISRFLRYLAPR